VLAAFRARHPAITTCAQSVQGDRQGFEAGFVGGFHTRVNASRGSQPCAGDAGVVQYPQEVPHPPQSKTKGNVAPMSR
jgi:hypothetical protein